MPAAAFMLSPVADWVRFDGESYETRAASDPMIEPGLCRFTAGQYVGNNDPETPLLYPVGMDLSGLPPLCIHVGDREVLLSDSVRLAARARAAGVNVRFKVWPGMWHFFQASARMVPEARQSITEISRFLSEQKES
jgi:monoterpene epsilon-lactone hydrolase